MKTVYMASAGVLSLCSAMPASAQSAPTATAPLAQPVPETTPDPTPPQSDAAAAPTPQAQSTSEQPQSAGVDDVVVTARREAENLQNVPVSEQVINGTALQKLAITSVEEVSKLAPGLTLVANNNSTSVTLRGVTWQPGSGTPATPIYFNEVPFDPGVTIQSLYDVGQIEVLRGPQGTTRGAPSISGAVTIATRRPDLDEFGGYVQGLFGEGDHKDGQGAINLPLIKGKLAIRLAANIENSDGDRVYSVNSRIQPFFSDRSYRGTVLFKPTDNLTIEGMYQRHNSTRVAYAQVIGTGSPGFAGVAGVTPAIPANYNGPALTLANRASVQDAPNYNYDGTQLITVNASWQVLGHTLSYNYGRSLVNARTTLNATDPQNIVPGFESRTAVNFVGTPLFQTNELRLSSQTSENRPFDYDIGWFSKHSDGFQSYANPTYLAGAFGSPATAVPGSVTTPNPRYVLNSGIAINLAQYFDSFYGNLRFHLDHNTELSGGLSIIRDRVPVNVAVTTQAAFNAFANPALTSRAFCPFAAAGAIASPVYTTGVVCEIGLPAGYGNFTQTANSKYSKAIYNFSLSHKFTDDLLVYATTGSSYRSGLPSIGNTGLPGNLFVPLPETAKSYEVGVKSSFGRRLRINVDAYQLDYDNQLTAFGGINYYSTVSLRQAQTNVGFYSNINARVRGVEAEIATRPFTALSLDANISYSRITSQGGTIPCNDASRPITATNPIDFCTSPKGQVLNQQAPFQATVNGAYEIPIVDAFGGYFRFNVNYQGHNPNFGNFGNAGTYLSTKGYALVDLFAGLTGKGSAWDLGIYAKNVFNQNVNLNETALINSVYTQFGAAGGYNQVRTNLPREIGLTVRYSFGSR